MFLILCFSQFRDMQEKLETEFKTGKLVLRVEKQSSSEYVKDAYGYVVRNGMKIRMVHHDLMLLYSYPLQNGDTVHLDPQPNSKRLH